MMDFVSEFVVQLHCIVATPYEKVLDTAKDVLDSTDQIYICRGNNKY